MPAAAGPAAPALTTATSLNVHSLSQGWHRAHNGLQALGDYLQVGDPLGPADCRPSSEPLKRKMLLLAAVKAGESSARKTRHSMAVKASDGSDAAAAFRHPSPRVTAMEAAALHDHNS